MHRRYRNEPRVSTWAVWALVSYLAIWQWVREKIVTECVLDMLLHTRDEVFTDIDRGIAAERLAFSVETFKAAAQRILNAPELPPVRPWIPRHRAELIAADGIPMALIESVFDIG